MEEKEKQSEYQQSIIRQTIKLHSKLFVKLKIKVFICTMWAVAMEITQTTKETAAVVKYWAYTMSTTLTLSVFFTNWLTYIYIDIY